MTRNFLLSIQRLVPVLLMAAAGAASAQRAVFDGGTGLLTLPGVEVGSATYVNVVLVFTPICSSCHDGSSGALPGAMNLSPGNSYANLVNVFSREVSLARVAPGDPEGSYPFRKLTGSGITGQRMPFGGPFLDDATIAMIRSWITSGAPNN